MSTKATRRDFLRYLLASPLLVPLIAASSPASARTPNLAVSKAPAASLIAQGGNGVKKFTILHTNDPHGHLLPFSYPNRVGPGSYVDQMPVRKNIGGIAHRAALVQKIKKSEKNVKVFDAGDCMDGTPFSIEFLGKADYDAMSQVGFDYGTLGNHDFNMTVDQFKEMLARIKYPLVIANVYEKGTDKHAFTPYMMENWDGLKVAVLGLLTYSTRTYKAMLDGYTMREPLSVAKELVPKLRKEADLVVVLSHDGYDEDVRLAQDIPGIDLIVGSHSHTRLVVGDYQVAAKPGKMDPTGAVIVQAHQWGGELGRLDLEVTPIGPDKKWKITSYSARLLPVTDDMPEDAATAKVVNGYWDQIKGKYAEVIGQAGDEFVEEDDNPTNYYLVADAIRDMTGAEFSLENFGGVRAPLLKGAITRGDLVTMDPFANTIYTFKIKGADLKKLIQYTRPATSATLRYNIKLEAPGVGDNKTDKPRWTLLEATLGGKPIADDMVYNGATSSFYFGKEVKKYAVDPVDSEKIRLDVVAAYIKKKGTVSPTADGRVNRNGASPYGN